MGLPQVLINLKKMGSTALARGQKGIVCVLLKELIPGMNTITKESEIPSSLTSENKEHIKRVLAGNPKKIITIENNTIAEALELASALEFNYIIGYETLTDEEIGSIVTWIKDMRDDKRVYVGAVLPTLVATHNYEGIISIDQEDCKIDSATLTKAQLCAVAAGIIAGCPLQESVTFKEVPILTFAPKYTKTQLDTMIDAGKFVIYDDGRKIKVARGVNSLTTLSGEKTEDMKYIKILETLDLIRNDIKRFCEDNWIGRYANTYDNKINLVVALEDYLKSLEKDSLLDLNKSAVNLDLEAIRAYLESKNVQGAADMADQELLEANTGTNVFIYSNCKPTNAIEDITINLYV